MSTSSAAAQIELRDKDTLVLGYIRLEIEEKLKIQVPSEIAQICYNYWKPMDIWNEALLIKSRSIVTNNFSLKMISEAMTTAFGTHIVRVNEACWWKLKMKHYELQQESPWFGITIGIVPNHEKKLGPLRFTNQWLDTYDIGFTCYWYDVEDGSIREAKVTDDLYRGKKIISEKHQFGGGGLTEPGDTLGMYLDLTKDVNTLRFTKNGKGYGKTLNVVAQDYRLAVSFGRCKGTEIQLV